MRMNRRHQRQLSSGRCWYGLLLFAVLLCSACEQSTPSLPQTADFGQKRHFTGTWTATGERETMQLGTGHFAAIFRYSGSLLLSGEQRVNAGFKGDIIGFADNRTGMQGRCTWTDENGDQLFSELHSESIEAGEPIKAVFIGGTGRYAGAAGEYSFKWQRLIEHEKGHMSGRVVDLHGWVLVEPGKTGSSATGAGQ